jgi:hypothetical protein
LPWPTPSYLYYFIQFEMWLWLLHFLQSWYGKQLDKTHLKNFSERENFWSTHLPPLYHCFLLHSTHMSKMDPANYLLYREYAHSWHPLKVENTNIRREDECTEYYTTTKNENMRDKRK